MSEKENESTGVEIASSTLLGDLMKIVIDEIKALPKVWQELSQSKQDGVIERVDKRVREAVTVCVELIASNGRSTIPAALEQVTVKDGIKGVVTVSKTDPKRHELTDAVGRAILIVVADPSDHFGGSGSVKSDPDQQALPMGEGGDDAATEGEVVECGGEAPPVIASELEENAAQGENGGGDDGQDMTADEVVEALKARGYAMKKHKVVALEDADYWALVDYLSDRGPAPVFLAEYAVQTVEG